MFDKWSTGSEIKFTILMTHNNYDVAMRRGMILKEEILLRSESQFVCVWSLAVLTFYESFYKWRVLTSLIGNENIDNSGRKPRWSMKPIGKDTRRSTLISPVKIHYLEEHWGWVWRVHPLSNYTIQPKEEKIVKE